MAVMRAFAAFAACVSLAMAACSPSKTVPSQSPPRPPPDQEAVLNAAIALMPGNDPHIRIVSLAPSITEIAYAVGCEHELVGDTTFDDYPAASKTLPHVADLSHVDLEALARLRPSLALALHDQEREGGEIADRLHVPVTYLPNRGMGDLYADISGVGHACGTEAWAKGVSTRIQREVKTIAGRADREPMKPRVLFLLGLPGFTAGKSSYLDDLIRMAGGVNVAGDVDQPYPDLSGEAIAAMQPDVIVVGHEVPFGQDVRSREPWRSLAAVRSGRVEVSPNDDLLERPGPRIVEGLAWLEKAIHKR